MIILYQLNWQKLMECFVEKGEEEEGSDYSSQSRYALTSLSRHNLGRLLNRFLGYSAQSRYAS